MELLYCMPQDDLLEDDLMPLSIASALLLPVVGLSPAEQDADLTRATDNLLHALRSVKVERTVN